MIKNIKIIILEPWVFLLPPPVPLFRLPVAGDGVEQSLPQDVDVVSQGQPEK